MFYNTHLEMFRKKTKKIKLIILFWALLGLILSILFLRKEVFWDLTINNALQWLLNIVEENKPTSDIFGWNTMTENIYKKALDWRKRKTAQQTTISLDKIQFINQWLDISKEDILNILYDSNTKVRLAIKKNVCWGVLYFLKECIKNQDIKNSYNRIRPKLAEKWIISNNNNAITDKNIRLRVNNQFEIISDNELALASFDEASLWEDLFLNWVAEDSDYDLQIDIQNIWDLLFESFISPVETVFYKLPPNYTGWWSSNNTNNQSNNSTQRQDLYTLLQNLLNPSESTNTWTITDWWSRPTTTQWSNSQQTNNSDNQSDVFDIKDSWLENFVKENIITQKASSQLQTIQWDVCRDNIVAEIPQKENEETINPDTLNQYIQDIQEQIENYNNLNPELQITPNIRDDPAFSWTNPNQTNQIIEQYIDSLFDSDSTQSCLNDCNSLPISERVIYQIQCACFSIGWPNDPDPRVKEMNEMLKLRFCMVPVKNMTVPKGKSIYSFDEVLNRIHAITYNLVNNWEMMKYQKTKEFLDSPIADFDFSKILSFQINLNVKPIFPNKTENAKKDQKKTEVENIIKNSKSKSNSEKDQTKSARDNLNLNKYLIVADPVKDRAQKEFSSNLEEYQKLYAKYSNIYWPEISATQQLISPNEEKKSNILDSLADFLAKNYWFRTTVENELQNINTIANSLQNQL